MIVLSPVIVTPRAPLRQRRGRVIQHTRNLVLTIPADQLDSLEIVYRKDQPFFFDHHNLSATCLSWREAEEVAV